MDYGKNQESRRIKAKLSSQKKYFCSSLLSLEVVKLWRNLEDAEIIFWYVVQSFSGRGIAAKVRKACRNSNVHCKADVQNRINV